MNRAGRSVDAYALGVNGWLTVGGAWAIDGNSLIVSATATMILFMIGGATRRVIRPLLVPEENLCPSCEYDLRGLGAGTTRCPECGTVMTKHRRGIARIDRDKTAGWV